MRVAVLGDYMSSFGETLNTVLQAMMERIVVLR